MLEGIVAFVKNLGSLGYFLNIAGVLLQYLILFFVYLFLYKIAKNIYVDLKTAKRSAVKSAGKLLLKVVTTGNIDRLSVGELFPVEMSLSLGRSETNDVVIAAPIVSAEHAMISVKKGNHIITDLGSTNGTFVNGKRIDHSIAINKGDEITIGPVRFNAQGE